MSKKIIFGLISGLWLAAGSVLAQSGEVSESFHLETQVLELQSSVGGREEFEAVQSGDIKLEAATVDADQDGAIDFYSSDADFDDRREFVDALIKEAKTGDENIVAVEISDEETTIRYKRPAKLFGIIPVAYTHAFTLDGKGNLSHGRPWWLMFAADDAADFELGVEAAFQHNQSNLDFLKLQSIIARQSRALQTLSNILKNRHEASMSAVRNMK